MNKNNFYVNDLYVYFDFFGVDENKIKQNNNVELIKDDLNKMTRLKIKKIEKESEFILEVN